MSTVTLESLTGEHLLSGIFHDSVHEVAYDGADHMEWKQVVRFTLDGKHYEAVEDPNDGYRSSLQCVRETPIAPEKQFPAARVVGVIRTQGRIRRH